VRSLSGAALQRLSPMERRPQDAAEMAVQIMVAGAREHLDLVLTG
jgi:hypothetical protein